MVFASTNKVYGRLLPPAPSFKRQALRLRRTPPARGASRNRRPRLHSPYGCSKGAADQYVRDYARVYGLRTAVLRMSCIYGPRQFATGKSGVDCLLHACSPSARPITIFGDGLAGP